MPSRDSPVDDRSQHTAGEQHLLENVIAKGRQENVSLRNSCSRLQDELTHVKSQLEVHIKMVTTCVMLLTY